MEQVESARLVRNPLAISRHRHTHTHTPSLGEGRGRVNIYRED